MELRHAVRSFRRAPWYSATVVGVIALGMALSTTVFAVVDGVLFKPLTYPQADRLVAIEPGFNNLPAAAGPSLIGRVMGASVQDIADWQAAAPDAVITGVRAQRLSGMGEGVNETLPGVGLVQRNFFDAVGVRPLVGGFAAADFDHEDIVRPVVIAYELWQGRFRGANDVIGRTYIDDPTSGRGFRVVGVMPRGFVFPSRYTAVRFIAPYVPAPDAVRDPTRRNLFEIIARRPPGMSIDAFRARVEAGMAETAAAFPPRGPKPAAWGERFWRTQGPFDHAEVLPLASALGSNERPLFRAILLAALILLALGGLNISGLMAARGLDRVRELSLRRALGATGVRIAWLLFLEILAPIAVGAVIGLFLAVPLLHVALGLLPEDLVLLNARAEPAIDARVVMFVLLSALVLAIPTTIWPIRRALRTAVASLGDGSRGSTGTRSIGRTVVIVSQVAGALVLTMGGALLIASILAVYANTPAIQTKGVVVLRELMQGLSDGNVGSAERTARSNALIDTLRRVPGVDAVALTDGQVLDGGGGVPWWIPPAAGASAAASRLAVVAEAVTSDFYRVLQPQLVMGRFPTDAELDSGAPVIVVSEAVGRAYWPNASPLGQTLMYLRVAVPFAVVGVVKDVRWNQWDAEVAAIYGPYARVSRSASLTVFIRSRKSAGQITADAIRAITASDPLTRTTQAATLDERLADSVRPRRFQSWLFGSFAMCALVIVGVGILGLIAMATARRTREIGIRLALGATRDNLVGVLLREQLGAVTLGVVVGSLMSAWAVRFVQVDLYQITPYDPRVWTAAVVAIVATAVVGTLIPALRASRVDPVQAPVRLIPFVILLLALSGSRALTQQPPQTVFRSQTDRVVVDAVITDAHGSPVRGLTRDDFRLFEDGRPRPILEFESIDLPIGVQPDVPPLPPIWSDVSEDVGSNGGVERGRLYMIVVDGYHMNRGTLTKVRKAVTDFVDKYLAPFDLAGLVFLGSTAAPVWPTANRAALLAGLSGASDAYDASTKIAGDLHGQTATRPVDVASADKANQMSILDADLRTLNTVEQVCRFLSTVDDRRKLLLLFSQGLDYAAEDTLSREASTAGAARDIEDAERAMLKTAQRTNVALYTFDPRGLAVSDTLDVDPLAPGAEGPGKGKLDSLRKNAGSQRNWADVTGGRTALAYNDYAQPFYALVTDASVYYRMTYAPPSMTDGRYHSISVKVVRPNVTIRARNGYTATRQAAASTPGAVLDRLLQRPVPSEAEGMNLRAVAGVVGFEKGLATVGISIEVSPEAFHFTTADDRIVDNVQIRVQLVDKDGRVVAQRGDDVELRLRPAGRDQVLSRGWRYITGIQVLPGFYQLRVAGFERGGPVAGSAYVQLHVPAPDGKPVIGGVFFATGDSAGVPTAGALPALTSVLSGPPTTDRSFSSADRLTARIQVAGRLDAIHEPAVRVSLVDATGAEKYSRLAPLDATEQASGGRTEPIDLSSLLPGRYLLVAEFGALADLPLAHPETAGTGLAARVPFALGVR